MMKIVWRQVELFKLFTGTDKRTRLYLYYKYIFIARESGHDIINKTIVDIRNFPCNFHIKYPTLGGLTYLMGISHTVIST